TRGCRCPPGSCCGHPISTVCRHGSSALASGRRGSGPRAARQARNAPTMPRVSPHERPFRFAVQASSASDGASWTDLARRVEPLGSPTRPMPDPSGAQLAPITAMAAAAAGTTTLRIASLVFDNDYRHPVVLAKEMATLDVLSGGRAELGLGAGWLATDY